MLKILVGVGLGFLFTSQTRQITSDLLRATANAIAPEQDSKTFQDRVKDAVVEKCGGPMRALCFYCSLLYLPECHQIQDSSQEPIRWMAALPDHPSPPIQVQVLRKRQSRPGKQHRIIDEDGNLMDLFYP